MRPLIFLCLFSFGCATTTSMPVLSPYKIVPLEKSIEERETLPKGEEQAAGMLTADKAPFDGVLLTERLATKYKLIKSERDKLRELLAIERQAAQQRHDLYNQALTDLHKQAQRSWLERHSGALGMYGGFILGAATCVLITYGVSDL